MSLAVSTPCIEMDGVSFGYGKQRLFENLNLSLADNEITAVCGPSGCGKSSLLKLTNALLIPQSGSIKVLGKPIEPHHLRELRLSTGYAVQRIGLFPHLSAEDNVRLVAQSVGMPAREQQERVQFLLEMFNLPSNLLARYPHELSGGQAQRVGLCRALMLKPRLLLLDEAFSAVDPISRFDIYREFLKLQEAEQFAVMLITHDMREARFLAKHILIMEDGHIVRQGRMEDVIAKPGTELVSRLIKEHLLCEV